MRTLLAKFAAFYGSNPLHLLGTIAAWALAAYTVNKVGVHALWHPRVWWQSIAFWFLASVVAHDLILFPLYAVADRFCTGALAAARNRSPASSTRRSSASPLNYLRVPTLAAALSLLLFLPGIVQQGQSSYTAATGQDQQPFFERWLLLVVGVYGVSALAYAARLAVAGRLSKVDRDSGTQPRSPANHAR
jgi:hypothetical protein